MNQSILMLVMGVLGILIYNLYKILPLLGTNTFSVAIFFKENKKYLIWTLSVMAVSMGIITIDPTANDIVKQWTSLDLANNTKGWLMFGIGLSGAIRNRFKLKSKNRTRKIGAY